MNILGIEITLQNMSERDLSEPQDSLNPANERLIGVMPLRLRQLFSLAQRYDRMAQEAEEHMDMQLTQEEKAKVRRCYLVCDELCAIVSHMLTVEAIEYFRLWRAECSELAIEFRQGWQVVAVDYRNVFGFPYLEVDGVDSDPHAWQ